MKRVLALILLLYFSGPLYAQSDFEVTEASLLQIQAALDTGDLTSVELTQKYLDRIATYDKSGPRLNSLVRINPNALDIAAALDEERRIHGPRGPLHGIPVIIKDNYNTTDLPTTGSSVSLAGFVPNANATQVDRLIEAGAIVIAKSNLHEFAYGITSISSLAGQTRNPYDPRRVPGGSSGGTGAAVAASFGTVGMGSDTCGSIRIPAAFNNLVGLRPSKGLSSIYGVMPLSHTQDVAGPLARNVSDLAIVLDTVSGHDPKDAATRIMADQPAPGFLDKLDSESLDGLRIGRLTDYFERADNAVEGVIDEAVEQLSDAGVIVVDLEIPGMAERIARSGLIGHEFRNDLNQYLANFGSGEISSLAEIVDQGLYHEAVEGALSRSRSRDFDGQAYQEAYAVRTELRALIEQTMESYKLDALLYPTIGALQVHVGESQPGSNCSISANSGLPAISVPAGFSANDLPVGMELLGNFMKDTSLVSIAYQIEKLLQTRQMPLTTPPLVDGRAPTPYTAEWNLDQNRLSLSGSFVYDQTAGQLEFEIRNASNSETTPFAVTLLIDEPPLGELNEPIIANLSVPGVSSATGEIFVDSKLHQALFDGRLYVRVFAEGIPATGLTERLVFNQ